MELILISENKLKIMLSDTDMKDYSLDCDRLDYDDSETKSILRSILDRAKYETGFDSGRGSIFIQLYPSREGGCEMYVTRLNVNVKKNDGEDVISTSGKRECAYSFERLDDLLCVCRRLSSIGYDEKSSVWRTKEKYYLLIFEPEENAYIPLSEYSFIREYGKSENRKNVLLLLAEKGSLIAEKNAVDLLSGF